MIKDLHCNERTKKILINELKAEKESGTYLIYGRDRILNLKLALSLAKSLNCKKMEKDFCDECESCNRMNTMTHGDLEYLKEENGIKIESARDLIYRMATSSYEGGKKIYILEDINKINIYAANSLLKIIEEPQKGNYFFLLATSLDVLPTIKSRSIIINAIPLSKEELDIDDEVYKFFDGNSTDILEFKKNNLSISKEINYKEIEKFIINYQNNGKKIEDKIDVYNSLVYFIKNMKWLDDIEKLEYVESLYNGFKGIEKLTENSEINKKNLIKEKEIVYDVLSYMAYLCKDDKIEKVQEILELKNKIRFYVNIKPFLIEIFM